VPRHLATFPRKYFHHHRQVCLDHKPNRFPKDRCIENRQAKLTSLDQASYCLSDDLCIRKHLTVLLVMNCCPLHRTDNRRYFMLALGLSCFCCY
jgi:hypothetical protein